MKEQELFDGYEGVRQEKRGLTRRGSIRRTDYSQLQRHPIQIVSWATDGKNVGSICRLSEAFLVEKLFCLVKPDKATACGTDKWQGIEVVDEHGLYEAIQATTYQVIALEQTNKSIPMWDPFAVSYRMCLLIGEEGSGLPQPALDLAYRWVEIPQYGLVGSLNVAAATGIALFRWAWDYA